MQTDVKLTAKTNSFALRDENAPGEKIGLMSKLFGCRHKKLTRPLTVERFSYCACLECGARKPFDAENMQTFGSFYFPPATAFIKK